MQTHYNSEFLIHELMTLLTLPPDVKRGFIKEEALCIMISGKHPKFQIKPTVQRPLSCNEITLPSGYQPSIEKKNLHVQDYYFFGTIPSGFP